ncbi:MAG: type II toxin-antitoxin system Phd/YefM family antitoxin [Chloroflexi bacterium]|nr:type II toxin-antitoxin system Phd/YefM family antitoxin [Chloroflexota bacterium]
MKNNPTVRVVSATEAKNKFGEMIKHAYAADEHLIVEKSGIPVVAIIPMADYQQLVKPRAIAPAVEQKVTAESKRMAAIRDLQEFLKRVHTTMPDVDEEEGERLIQQTVDEIRAERAHKILAESRATYTPRRRTHRKK